MDFIVFLSIAFGLFGIFVDKYISLRREIYLLWTEEIVYKRFGVENVSEDEFIEIVTCSLEDAKKDSNKGANKIGSKVDVYARDIYSIIRIIKTLVYVILFITVIAILSTLADLKNAEINPQFLSIFSEHTPQNLYLLSGLLFLISIAMISILISVDIDIIIPGKHTETEEKLFDIWCKYFCRCYKNKPFQKYLQPFKMFEILADKINEYDIKVIDAYRIMYRIMKNQIDRRNIETNERSNELREIMEGNNCLRKKMNKGRINKLKTIILRKLSNLVK